MGPRRRLLKRTYRSSIRGARPAELKRLLFLHFYGTDFEPEERKRIASALSKKPPRPPECWSLGKPATRKPSRPKNIGHREGLPARRAVREKRETYGAKKKSKAKRPPGRYEAKQLNGWNGLNILNGNFLGDRDLGCQK